MRVLLDEHVPRQLSPEIRGHEVLTVGQVGWAGIENGELLRRAAAVQFAAFVTMDRNLEFQQNVRGIAIGIVVLIARNGRIQSLLPLVPELLRALAEVRPGEVRHVPG